MCMVLLEELNKTLGMPKVHKVFTIIQKFIIASSNIFMIELAQILLHYHTYSLDNSSDTATCIHT